MPPSVNELTASWRRRAMDLQPFAPDAAVAFRVAARQLETALGGRDAEDPGETFVLAALRSEPGLSTTELRERARGAGVSSASVTRALPLLEAQGLIGFDPAPRNRKRWHVRGDPTAWPAPENPHTGLVQSLSDKLSGVPE